MVVILVLLASIAFFAGTVWYVTRDGSADGETVARISEFTTY